MPESFRDRESEHLLLREVREEDTEDLFELFSDPLVAPYVDYAPHRTLEDTKRNLNYWRNRSVMQHLPLPYVLVLKEENKVIGNIDYTRRVREDGAEIGYQLNSRYWGNGYMAEALAIMVEESFLSMGLRRLQVCHQVGNTRSQRVIEKAGFIYEGTARKYAYDRMNKEFADVRFYSLLKEEWKEKRDL